MAVVDNQDMGRFIFIAAVIIFIACSGPVRQTVTYPEPLAKKSARQLVLEANKHIGEPYRYGGTSSGGWDCSGFVRTVFSHSLSLQLPRSSEEMHSLGIEIPLAMGRAGDLVFFNIKSKKPSHVGIYIGNYDFIHVSSTQGVVISSLQDQYYKRHFLGIRRIPFSSIAISR